MPRDNDPEACPLAAVDRRLDDLHRAWHEALDAYFKPDVFRVKIQAAIQTARTITFIAQSNKRAIPDFDQWYGAWQERFRADALMRWMVEARNRIEKQGDLVAHSFVRAEIIASYLEEGPTIEVPADLFQGPAALLRSLPKNDLGEHIVKHGALRVQRRWVENSLPEYELLDAVALAYGQIAQFVADAHRQVGLPEPQHGDGEDAPTPDGRLPCMVWDADHRTTTLSFSRGERLKFTHRTMPIDRKAGPKLEKRYGIAAKDIFAGQGNMEEELHSLFKTARAMTERDGSHVTICFLFKKGKTVKLVRMAPADQADKFLLMRELGKLVARLSAEAVIMIGEAWAAEADPTKPYMRASEAADRHEQLVATLVRKDGDPVHLSARFRRGRFVKRKVSLEETVETRGGTYMMFAAVYEAWGKPIPQSWMEESALVLGARPTGAEEDAHNREGN